MPKTKAEYNKTYYNKHRETILDCTKEICECGSKVASYHKSRHLKTKKHVNYLEKINQN